jgi:hypothetical protein
MSPSSLVKAKIFNPKHIRTSLLILTLTALVLAKDRTTVIHRLPLPLR